jgi:hypothetical protein
MADRGLTTQPKTSQMIPLMRKPRRARQLVAGANPQHPLYFPHQLHWARVCKTAQECKEDFEAVALDLTGKNTISPSTRTQRLRHAASRRFAISIT